MENHKIFTNSLFFGVLNFGELGYETKYEILASFSCYLRVFLTNFHP